MNEETFLYQLIDDLRCEYEYGREYIRTGELIKSLGARTIGRKYPFKDQILDGSIIPNSSEKHIQLKDLQEGDVWIISADFDYLTVSQENNTSELSDVYYEYSTNYGIFMYGKLPLLIQKVNDDEIIGTILGPVANGKSLTIKKDLDFDRRRNYDCLVMTRDSLNHQELKMLIRLEDVYEENKSQIEERVQKIYEIANDIYPGMVEMKDIFTTRKDSMCRRLFSSGYLHALVIRFPEIEITNSRDDRHTIQELYVGLPISLDGSCGYLYGVRAKMEAKEIATRYAHSHLSDGKDNFASFCLGTGSFSNNLAILRHGYNEELWEICLTQLLYYVSWESLSGGPYHRMQKAITGGADDKKYMSQYDIARSIKELNNILPEEIMESAVTIKVHDSGGDSIQVDISGLDKVAKFIEQFEDYDDLEYLSQERLNKCFVYVSTDNRRIGYLKLSDAYAHVEAKKTDPVWKTRWETMGFDFQGEKITQELYVDESLYNESYTTSMVDMNRRLKNTLSAYITMNFMNKTTEQVNQLEQQNDKYNEYKEQQERFPEEITACTPVY